MDDLKRPLASTRAELVALRRRLVQTEDRLRAAEEDARKLAEFIQDSASLHVWQHADVARLVETLLDSTVNALHRTNALSASRGSPASHILYARLIAECGKDARARMGDLLESGLAAPHRVTEEMRRDILSRMGEDDR